MAHYHIGRKSGDGRYATVYAHLPVPATQTVAGAALSDATLTYQAVQAETLADGYSPQAPKITAAEITQIENGELIEKVYEFGFSRVDLTNVERRSEIEDGNDNMQGVISMITDMSDPDSGLYIDIISPLDWWGYSRNVVI